MTEQSIYSWEIEIFTIQKSPDFLKKGAYIWVFDWHEIPHLGFSLDGQYYSISISGTNQHQESNKIWRLAEIKTSPLFFIHLKDQCIQFKQINSLFTKPIQEGETCLKPLKELLALNSGKVETLTHLIKKLEENKQVIGYHSNGLHATMCLTLLNYNKADVLEMINNKIQLYETRK